MADDNGQLVAVRATVHLPGLPLGARALVDPTDPYIRDRLAARHIVREETATAAAPEDDPADESSETPAPDQG